MDNNGMINGSSNGQNARQSYAPTSSTYQSVRQNGPTTVYPPQQQMQYHNQTSNTMGGGGMAGLEYNMNAMNMQPTQTGYNQNYGNSMAQQSMGGWNVNAMEFVPRTAAPAYNTYNGHNAYNGGYNQQQMMQYPMDPYAMQQQQLQPFDPSWLNEPGFDQSMLTPQISFSDQIMREMHGINGSMLMEIQVGIEQLTSKPEESEVWMEAIVARLTTPRTASLEQMHLVNQMIFETAAAQPSASYILAVLLAYMCKHASLAESFLMRCILPHCRSEHEQRFAHHLTDPLRLRSFAQLLAELYLRLTTRAAKCRIDILGTAVYEEVDTLFSDPANEENVKCAARVLKCCGSALDCDNPERMEDVIGRIKSLVENTPTMSTSTRDLLKSVITLQANEWGNKASAANGTAKTNEPTDPSGLFIGPDGEPLSEEERKFLEENCGNENGDKSEDEDYTKAYDDFVRYQQ